MPATHRSSQSPSTQDKDETFSETSWARQDRRIRRINSLGVPAGIPLNSESDTKQSAMLQGKSTRINTEDRATAHGRSGRSGGCVSSKPPRMATPRGAQRQSCREGERALQRARVEAKARTSACLEDLIAFLEMHSLTGAYALAFAACGVEDLAQLLAMPTDALNELIVKCDIEAMDEIILRDALRSKAGQMGTQRHMVLDLMATEKPTKTIDLSSPTDRRRALKHLRDLEARYMVHAAEASAAERLSLFKLGDDESPSNFDPANPNLFGPEFKGGA